MIALHNPGRIGSVSRTAVVDKVDYAIDLPAIEVLVFESFKEEKGKHGLDSVLVTHSNKDRAFHLMVQLDKDVIGKNRNQNPHIIFELQTKNIGNKFGVVSKSIGKEPVIFVIRLEQNLLS